MKIYFLVIFCLLVLTVTSYAQKATPPKGGTPKPFSLPQKEQSKLKNGVKVTLIPYGSIPKASIRISIRTGSIDETENQVWLSDLTALFLKEGTKSKNATQIAEEIAQMGGTLSIKTGLDEIVLSGDVLSEFAPDFIRMVADILQKPLLPESEIARLKANLLRNLTISKSDQVNIANELFRKILYPNHPYGRGYPNKNIIENFKMEDIKRFHQENFTAARTSIYVSGVFDTVSVKEATSTGFEAWGKGKVPTINIPRAFAERTVHLIDRPEAVQTTLLIGLPVIVPSHPDYITLLLTDALLGGAFGSRITANIREEKGYTYSPISLIYTNCYTAYWVESADVNTDKTGASISEVFLEIDRLSKKAPTEKELEGIKNYMIGAFILQNATPQGAISQLAFLDMHNLEDQYMNQYIQKILAITPNDVQRVTKMHLNPDKMSIVAVGNKLQIESQLKEFGEVIEHK